MNLGVEVVLFVEMVSVMVLRIAKIVLMIVENVLPKGNVVSLIITLDAKINLLWIAFVSLIPTVVREIGIQDVCLKLMSFPVEPVLLIHAVKHTTPLDA